MVAPTNAFVGAGHRITHPHKSISRIWKKIEKKLVTISLMRYARLQKLGLKGLLEASRVPLFSSYYTIICDSMEYAILLY